MTLALRDLVARDWTRPLDRRFAEAMGRLAGESDPLALLGAAVASRFTGDKHVCVDLARIAGLPIQAEEGRPLDGLRWPDLDEWTAALASSALVGRGGQPAPLMLEGSRLYLYRYWDYERRLAEEIECRSTAADDVDTELFAAALDREFPAPDHGGLDLQRTATAAAVSRRLVVISGGPGTGKTATVARILALLVEQALARGAAAPRIALVAPTGKAAARLRESVRTVKAGESGPALRCDERVCALIPEDAATIHRTLGYRPRTPTRFRHQRSNPLPVDALVVDEASMVDLPLMVKLIEAVPLAARLILLGDRDQLASVDAGAVLGDICNAGDGAQAPGESPIGLHHGVVQLTHSFRFGRDSAVGRLARAINENRPGDALDLLRSGDDAAVRLIEVDEHARLEQLVAADAAERYRPLLAETEPRQRLAHLDDARVLCAHRRGLGGAERLNAEIAERLAGEGLIDRREAWYSGRPVMIGENDYSLGLFNGDTGLTLEDPITGRLRVCFVGADGEQRSLAPSRLPAHETVFATTVHKSQGSEFGEVLVVLPPIASPVVTRELLYTAVTRSRKRVTIYGSEGVLRAAVAAQTVRYSGLRERLWG